MALDMANGDDSSVAVRGLVSFYLVAPTILLVLAEIAKSKGLE